MKKAICPVLGVLVLAAAVQAERPPQFRDKAQLVVTGTVSKLTTRTSAFGGDGVRTNYSAEVKVDAVERGEKVKPGDTITVTWFHVTKRPTRPIAGAFGQAHAVKEKDTAKFWLMEGGKGAWTVIYNRDGVEKVKK